MFSGFSQTGIKPGTTPSGYTGSTADSAGNIIPGGAFASPLAGSYYTMSNVNESTAGTPSSTELSKLSIYPNPAVEKFTISYYLKQDSHVEARMYDISGQVISILVDEDQDAGGISKSFVINDGIKPGIYFVKVIAENTSVQMKKLIIR